MRDGSELIIKVRNKSKALKWIFGPELYGIPGEGEDMIWLSHWSMLESQLEGGDEVAVSVGVRRHDFFQIKECGVQVVQQEKEENMPCLLLTHPDFLNSLDPYIDWKLYESDSPIYSDWDVEDSDVDQFTDNEEQTDEDHTVPAAAAAEMSAEGSMNRTPGFRKWMVLMAAVISLVLSIYICSPIILFPG